MKTLRIAVVGALMAAASTGTFAAAEPSAPEASKEAAIPFINLRQSIHSWQDDGQMGLWIEDVRKQWYYAKLQSPCIGLEFAVQLGFQTKTVNSLDKFGTVIVPRGGRCPIMSLVKSDPPPDKKKRHEVGEDTK
jgi:hypothetical protein